MKRTLIVAAACALAAFGLTSLSGCMSISAYNNLTPREETALQAVTSEAYGEGARRTLDVYVPESRPSNAPVVVFFYGGGWSSGAKEDYRFAGEAFAAQGFVTVVPDYRVYPEVRFPDFVEDAAQAIKWTQENVERFGGDASRIVLVGHSAGAHIAMLAALDPQYAEAAGFNARAIRGVAGLAGPYGFDSFEMPLLRNVFGPPEDPNIVQPIHYVRRGGPALLLLAGDSDRRVPISSLTHMERAAREAGEPVESKLYANLDHPGILQALGVARRDQAPVLSDVATFARRVTS